MKGKLKHNSELHVKARPLACPSLMPKNDFILLGYWTISRAHLSGAEQPHTVVQQRLWSEPSWYHMYRLCTWI